MKVLPAIWDLLHQYNYIKCICVHVLSNPKCSSVQWSLWCSESNTSKKYLNPGIEKWVAWLLICQDLHNINRDISEVSSRNFICSTLPKYSSIYCSFYIFVCQIKDSISFVFIIVWQLFKNNGCPEIAGQLYYLFN